MGDSGADSSSRDDLFNLGWRQGAVFKPSIDTYSLVNKDASSAPMPRKLKESELLLIVSHDCDIASRGYPHIECLVCKTLKAGKQSVQEQLARITLEEPRKFVVDRQRGLVAETTHRVLFEKSILTDLPPPEFYISDPVEVHRFRKWLSGRYSRPGRAGWIHDLVIGSLLNVLRSIQENDPASFTVFNELVHDIRFDAFATDGHHVRLGLLIISRDDEQLWTDARVAALDGVMKTIEASLVDHDQIDFVGTKVTVLSELLHVAYLKTESLPTDWASFEQGEYVGAPPVELLEDNAATEVG